MYREDWLDLLRWIISHFKRFLALIYSKGKNILLWVKNRNARSKKKPHREISFTIHLKWVLAGIVLIALFHPHNQAQAEPQPVPYIKPVVMAKKIEQTKLKPQEEVAEIKTQTANASLSAIPSIVSNCGDNEYANFIYMHESGCSLTSVNSIGCVGIGQSCGGGLESACPNWQTDYACQNSYFSQYANSRYGGWSGAYGFWVSAHWW